jgi:DME family drug/metabolite transporter
MFADKLTPGVKGLLLTALAAALWGTTGIAAKLLFTTSDLPALTLAFLRLAIAAPLFLALWRRLEARPASSPRAGSWLVFLGLTQAGYQAAYLGAVDLAGAGLATLVALCLAPVIVALVAIPLLGERFNQLIVAGLIGAIAGTSLLVMGGESIETNQQRLLGVGVAAVAAAIYGGFTLISRHTAGGRGPYQTAFVCFSTGALILLPMVLWQGGLDGLAELSLLHVLLILYVGIVPTCLGYICFFNGIRHTPATTSSIIVTLEPLFAALLAWLILDENLGAWGVAGAAVLVLAVAAASRGSRMV